MPNIHSLFLFEHEFDDFLCASIGEEENGMALSVMSEFARPERPACHVSDPPFEFIESLLRDAPLARVIRDAEPKKLALFRSRHRALRLVDLEPQLVGQEPAHRSHDPFAGRTRPGAEIRCDRQREMTSASVTCSPSSPSSPASSS